MSMGDGPEERHGLRAVAWAAAVLVLGVIAAGIWYDVSVRAKRDRAQEQVNAWARRLDADRDESGRWNRWPGAHADETDPWGNRLRVTYVPGRVSVTLVVSSDGPDGRQWTSDDIGATARNIAWLELGKGAAGAVEDTATSLSRGLVGGAIEGVTDHLPRALREKWGIPSSRDGEQEKP